MTAVALAETEIGCKPFAMWNADFEVQSTHYHCWLAVDEAFDCPFGDAARLCGVAVSHLAAFPMQAWTQDFLFFHQSAAVEDHPSPL